MKPSEIITADVTNNGGGQDWASQLVGIMNIVYTNANY
jgi:hypothetical protein